MKSSLLTINRDAIRDGNHPDTIALITLLEQEPHLMHLVAIVIESKMPGIVLCPEMHDIRYIIDEKYLPFPPDELSIQLPVFTVGSLIPIDDQGGPITQAHVKLLIGTYDKTLPDAYQQFIDKTERIRKVHRPR